MAFRTVDDSNFVNGVNKEIPSWELPRGTLADASNMIFDIPGIARQRNGSTALSSPTTTAFSTSMGFCYSNDATTLEELYAPDGKSGDINVVNKTTGAKTLVSNTNADVRYGRPVRHFGFITFPYVQPTGISPGNRVGWVGAGQTSSTTFTNAVAAQVSAGTPTFTLTGADVTTNVKVGGIVLVVDTTNNIDYFGRVVSIDTTKIFTVWPTPTWTNAAIPIGTLQVNPTWGGQGGTCVTSFQNRILFGNTPQQTQFPVGNPKPVYQNRVLYSPLPTETSIITGAPNKTAQGALFGYSVSWPVLNYFEVPPDPIIAMEPVSDNELLILTNAGVVIFRGTLATQTTTSAPGITFDISPLNTNAGCLSDFSVQRTPHGIVWASAEGIMLYTGGGRSPIDLTAGKYHTAWRNLTRGSSFAVHGAFYARNHYVITGISGGTTFALCFNMDNQTWAPLSGPGMDVFLGAPRPTDLSTVYVNRWWDQSGAAPSHTGGHVVRVDSLFAPDVVGQTKLDSDGAVVPFSLTTRAVTDDVQSERFLRRAAARYAATHTAFANVTVAAGSRIDTTDSAGTPTVSIGNLSNTSVLTITGQSNATPIVITTSVNHGLQTGDEVDIRGVTTNSNANGHWRITVISVTTFSLNASVGNGATTSTGTCHKITEQELDTSTADPGQGNYLAVASAGTVNKFEWHGMRLGVMEMLRGMGR